MTQGLPREHRAGFGWPVDLDEDDQGSCSKCGAAIYWVEIVTKKGEIKNHPLSARLVKRDGEQVYLGSHFSDCKDAQHFRPPDVKREKRADV